jgi:peptide/nickel transport system substrate-binding protein
MLMLGHTVKLRAACGGRPQPPSRIPSCPAERSCAKALAGSGDTWSESKRDRGIARERGRPYHPGSGAATADNWAGGTACPTLLTTGKSARAAKKSLSDNTRVLVLAVTLMACAQAQSAAQLRFTVPADPKTFDPLLATEAVSETIRYLTGGVLIRLNRSTQQLEAELAASWKVLDQGRRIDFVLRRNVNFSDGAPFGPADVVATIQRLTRPGLQSGIADTFRAEGGEIRAQTTSPDGVTVYFSTPVAGLEALFDQLAITPARKVAPESAVLGPFMLQEHKGGQYVLLKRNPRYWKTDAGGSRLPYLDSIRLDIQSNRETELLRYRRGELHLVDKLEPDAFERLTRDSHAGVLNVGPSLDSEFFWFNQSPAGQPPPYKQRWFQSKAFRRAISAAVNRDDIVRVVYRGYAHGAASSVSPGNKFWFDAKLLPPRYDPGLALKLLQQDGFHLDAGILRDRDGNRVEFSMITNAGSKTRTLMGTILQQDLTKIGVRLNFLPIEFQSLVERITRTQQYEACLLGFSNVDIDPNTQMNIWLSSGGLHPWNPGQAKPSTSWEDEIDRLMQAQRTAWDPAARKKAFDSVQEIVAEQAPAVFLVYPDILVAVSPLVRNAAPSPLPPHLYWNIEYLSLAALGPSRKN